MKFMFSLLIAIVVIVILIGLISTGIFEILLWAGLWLIGVAFWIIVPVLILIGIIWVINELFR